MDPDAGATEADLKAQFDLAQTLVAKIDETHKAVKRIRRVKAQVEMWKEQLTHVDADEQKRSAVEERAKQLIEQLHAVEGELVTSTPRPRSTVCASHAAERQAGGLINVVTGADAAPTRQAYDVFEHLSAQVDAQLDTLESILGEGVADFNAGGGFEGGAVVG
ncbi:MAG: hypothetical protein R2856_35165 [Caldilineaceae bacterium]